MRPRMSGGVGGECGRPSPYPDLVRDCDFPPPCPFEIMRLRWVFYSSPRFEISYVYSIKNKRLTVPNGLATQPSQSAAVRVVKDQLVQARWVPEAGTRIPRLTMTV